MHSHLIPGIDDGSPDMDTSLKLIRGLADLGYTKLVTTPHIMWDMYPNNRDSILQKLEWVRNAVIAEGIPVEIHAGAEYFLDDHVAGLLKKNEPLLTISGKMVLTEFSLAWKPHGIKDILFDMQMQGYQPVIAHPERYIYLQQNKEFYEELRDIGCLFQLNMLALTGHYGKSVQELANYLVKKNFYDLIGTDLHHAGHLGALHNPALAQQVQKLLQSGRVRNMDL
jgi:protein-tyrosine phosphatase